MTSYAWTGPNSFSDVTQSPTVSASATTAMAGNYTISVTDAILEKIVSITAPLNLEGHRADIVIMKAARALAAFHGQDAITTDNIREAARLALPHRMKRLPFEAIGRENEILTSVLAELAP